ncbi:hypothetical protein LAh8_20 [Aeromonas phage LAh_8]|uniref:DUF3307 domain-containing protein n=3 Tax=Lahexavirus TaxID=2843411 RepID=A0A513ZZV7_9CAUD|nr:membrane protein [Aeromonas phage 4_4572]YP_009847301.1 membrane protein [Aeromonas phage LAh_6]YP_009847358.1 membrane protein [Aeromonas phage LAh_8]QDH46558.1 hypothetical protein LAh6_127 [Aeromonas phage LAh_6]QDH46794.1 hypothetical protein LAh8_20 [Aeromonas phage LAh_8]QEG09118.1 hypothetical protein [Aeromonas phage 4_4572]
MDMYIVFFLLVIFQIKHFVADYILQNTYMLGKFRKKGWVLPLSAHCIEHGIFTFLIFLWAGVEKALMLAAVDFSLHFVMDRIKASPNIGGRYNNQQPQYWYMLGFDQMFHHLTHYWLIWYALYC